MDNESVYSVALEVLQQCIQERRMRNTVERQRILEQICTYQEPFTAEHLKKSMQANFPISDATVYNTLDFFASAGIIHRMHKQKGNARTFYELLVGHKPTMVFLCTKCGRESKFTDKMFTTCFRQHKFNNFVPTSFSIYVYGTCKYCRRKKQNDQ